MLKKIKMNFKKMLLPKFNNINFWWNHIMTK